MTSTVVTWLPPQTPGGLISQPYYLGRLGSVTPPTYSYALPGGPDKMTCVLAKPPGYRHEALNPGRVVQVCRGAQVIWDGKMLEGVPAAGGWQVSASGLGQAAVDYDAIYGTWSNQNDALNQAIGRGFRVSNPGVPSGVWLGQQQDSGSITIADLLNLFCTLGGYYWYIAVNPTGGGGILNVTSFPQAADGPLARLTPDRILVCNDPAPRNLGGDINTVVLRYQSASGGATGNPTYAVTTVSTSPSILKHQTVEHYEDISSAGTMTATAAQALGQNLLNRYVRASFSGPFNIRQGSILTMGGQAVDVGMETAGHIYQLILTDYGYGGEVTPGPVTFLSGAIEWNDQARTGTLTPYQAIDLSLTSLFSAALTGRSMRGTAAQEWAAAHRHKPRRRRIVAHRAPGGGPVVDPGGPVRGLQPLPHRRRRRR
jgi:hypothetical protein